MQRYNFYLKEGSNAKALFVEGQGITKGSPFEYDNRSDFRRNAEIVLRFGHF